MGWGLSGQVNAGQGLLITILPNVFFCQLLKRMRFFSSLQFWNPFQCICLPTIRIHECLDACGHFLRFTLAFVSSMESMAEYFFDMHSVSQCAVYCIENVQRWMTVLKMYPKLLHSSKICAHMFVSNDEALAGRLKRTSAQFMDRLSRLQADSELHYQTIKSKVMVSSLLVQMIKESGRNQIYRSLPSKQGSGHRDQWGNEKENTGWTLGISAVGG